MEIFRSELHGFPLRAFVDEAKEALGEDGLRDLLGGYGLSAAAFSDTSAWFSLEFVEALLEEMARRIGDPGFLARAIVRGTTAKYMGPLFPLLFTFGSPLFTYNQLPKLAGRVNKTGTWVSEEARLGFVRVSWTSRQGSSAETSPLICRARLLQLARVPTLFGLPPATIEHPRCLMRNDSACTYEIRWTEPGKRRHAVLGGTIGGVAGSMLVLTSMGPSLHAAVVGLGFAVGGWALGKAWVLRQDLGLRVTDIEQHNQALDKVTRANEERFAELLGAKAEIEQKVEQRTEQLRSALTQIQALDQAKTEFFTNVSHDLRTPLQLILGPLPALLAGQEPDGGTHQALVGMDRNAARLLSLINNLLDLAKADAGKITLSRTPVNPAALARSAQDAFKTSAAAAGKELLVSADDSLPVALLDPYWLESALSNLLANAMRFARATIDLRVRGDAGALTFEVQDDGPGIAAEDLPHMFERFAQAGDSLARKGGTGLGLAIVKIAATLHGGTVSVRSNPGMGTIFTLTVPLQVSAAVNATPLPPPANLAVATVVDERRSWPGPHPAAPLIVAVEDDQDLRVFLGNTLAREYRVLTARDGQEGLQLVRAEHPDAVVSDVAMPRMNGYDLCRQLRERVETRTLPILLLTARADVTRVLEGFAAGADDYVTKPFAPEVLLKRLAVHLRLRAMVHEMAHRERLASLGVLAASVAHQVRNPLAAILSGLPAVRRKLAATLDPRSDELLGVMVQSAERVEKVTRDLLDLSRVDRGEVERFGPGAGLRSSVRMIEARLPVNVKIESDIDDDVLLDGRPGDMNHVFLNLIDNAARAVEQGGTVRVRAHATPERHKFVLAVEDSGAGVDPDQAESIFTPFFTTRRAGEGTGLGLSIARQVVLQHGGTITVGRSDLGGALFTVTLPTPQN